MAKTNPMSPIRLYRMACRAAVLASVRPYHQPIRRNDIIPTPSHPINSWNRLLDVTRIIIVIRNMSRYLKKRLIWGSECIYHIENSIIDHVTNNATGIKSMEKQSSLKLIESLKVWTVIQCQLEIISSQFRLINIIAGIRQNSRAKIIEVFTQFGNLLFMLELEKVRRIGKVSVMSDISMREENMFITFIWSCTNFLVPKTNGLLLSYKS